MDDQFGTHITFYRSSDHVTLETSVAQVFNQRGDGVIVRGAAAKVSRQDRQPHLARSDAESLLTDSFSRYRKEHRHPPARVVLHKTSSYTAAEIAGFRDAADATGWMPSNCSGSLPATRCAFSVLRRTLRCAAPC